MHEKRGGGGCIGGGGGLQGVQPMPSRRPLDTKCQSQRHLQPTVTAPNRFGNLPLQPA